MRAFVCLLAVLGALQSSAQTDPALPGGWTRPETVLRAPAGMSGSPEIAILQGTPSVTIPEWRFLGDSVLVGDALLLSTRQGSGWTLPVRLDGITPLHGPSIATNGFSLDVAWMDGPSGRADRVLFEDLTDASAPVTETVARYDPDGPQPHIWPGFERLVAGNGHPAVLFELATTSGLAIAFSRRQEGGGWSPPAIVAAGSSGDLSQAPDGTFVLAYLALNTRTAEQSVSVAVSNDSGDSWQVSPVAARPRGERQATPRAILDGRGRLHVAWVQSSNNTQEFDKLMYAYSDDRGGTWSIPETLTSERGWISTSAQLVADSEGNPHAFVFQQAAFLSQKGEIVHRARRADGRWTPERTLFGADSVGWAWRAPGLAVSDGRLHATWSAYVDGETHIQYASAPLSWLTAQVLPDTSVPDGARAFPNPATDSVTFLFTPSTAGTVTFRLSTTDGRTVVEERLGERPAGAQRYTRPTADLAAGTYLFSFTTATAHQSGTVAIVH